MRFSMCLNGISMNSSGQCLRIGWTLFELHIPWFDLALHTIPNARKYLWNGFISSFCRWPVCTKNGFSGHMHCELKQCHLVQWFQINCNYELVGPAKSLALSFSFLFTTYSIFIHYVRSIRFSLHRQFSEFLNRLIQLKLYPSISLLESLDLFTWLYIGYPFQPE